MQLGAAVIQLAARAAEQQEQQEQQEGEGHKEAHEQGPEAVLRHAVSQTLLEVLALLLAEQPPQPKPSRGTSQPTAAASPAKAAAQHLLPAALQAAAWLQQGEAALQQLWETCRWVLLPLLP